MSNIINGNLATIKSSTIPCMMISSSGTEVSTGTLIFSGASIGSIESSVIYMMPVDISGNALR